MNVRMATEFLRSKINRLEEIADFIERQEQYAELGRLSISEVRGTVCSIPTFRQRSKEGGCDHCKNCNFCTKRAALEGAD